MRRKPKTIHIPVYLLLACLLLIVIISAKDVPGLTDNHRFRLAETAQLVGPSKIIGQEDLDYSIGKVIIGESNYGYSLYKCDTEDLYYHPKLDGFTTFCPNKLPDNYVEERPDFPIFVFTENSSGVTARLTLDIFTTNSGALLQYSYFTEAQRSENGYFLFRFALKGKADSRLTGFLPEMLNDQPCSWVAIYGRMTLNLYDNNGNLLESLSRDYYVPDTEQP